jgi:hypothetical protein
MGRSEAATIRRAEKRQRTVDEQRRIDSAVESRRLAGLKAAEAEGGAQVSRNQKKRKVEGVEKKTEEESESGGTEKKQQQKESRYIPKKASGGRATAETKQQRKEAQDFPTKISSGSATAETRPQRKESRGGSGSAATADAAAVVVVPKFCHMCGGALVPEARFCSSCGAGVLTSTAPAAAPAKEKAKTATAHAPAGKGRAAPAEKTRKSDEKTAWAPQADADRIKENMEIRQRFATDRESLTPGLYHSSLLLIAN